QVKSRVSNAHHIVKAPPDGEFAANRRRRSDRPVHEYAARHPCHPPTDQCPISGGGTPTICSSRSQRSVARVARIPTTRASIAAFSGLPQEAPIIETNPIMVPS